MQQNKTKFALVVGAALLMLALALLDYADPSYQIPGTLVNSLAAILVAYITKEWATSSGGRND